MQLRRLSLYLSPRSATMATLLPDTAGSLAVDRFPVAPTPSEPAPFDNEFDLSRLEEAVYANPELTADYARVDIVVDTDRFMPVPAELSDALTEKVLEKQPLETIVCCPAESAAMKIAVAMPTTLHSFLNRAFRNPHIHTPLSLLANYAATVQNASAPRLYVSLTESYIDIVAFNAADRTIEVANRFRISAVVDAAYYVCAVLSHTSSSAAVTAEPSAPPIADVAVAAPADLRRQLIELLAEASIKALPAIFPPHVYRYGAAAASLPFALTLSMLCE